MSKIMKRSSYSQFFKHNTPKKAKKKSLNSNLRKKDLVQITLENEKLLKRLNGVKSSFDLSKLNKERKEHEKLLDNI
jgi:ribosomal protein S2